MAKLQVTALILCALTCACSTSNKLGEKKTSPVSSTPVTSAGVPSTPKPEPIEREEARPSAFTPTQFAWRNAQVTIDASWKNHPDGYDMTAAVIRGWFKECSEKIEKYLGRTLQYRNCLVKYKQGKYSAVTGGAVRLSSHLEMVTTVAPTEIVLSSMDKLILTHEIIHFLLGIQNCPDSGFNEGYTDTLARLVHGVNAFEGMPKRLRFILENLIDDPAFRKVTWNIERNLAIGWLASNNDLIMGNVRYVIWTKLLMEFEAAHPGFIKRYFHLAMAEKNPMTVNMQRHLAEKAQKGFLKWYRAQPAFQESKPGRYLFAKQVKGDIVYFAFTRTIKPVLAAMDRVKSKIKPRKDGVMVMHFRAAMTEAPLERMPAKVVSIALVEKEGKFSRTSYTFRLKLPSPIGCIQGVGKIPGKFLYGELQWDHEAARFELK